jgi:hypothetical protein
MPSKSNQSVNMLKFIFMKSVLKSHEMLLREREPFVDVFNDKEMYELYQLKMQIDIIRANLGDLFSTFSKLDFRP